VALKEVSARIKTLLGGRHFPARLGGDEFAIIFDPDTELLDTLASSGSCHRAKGCRLPVNIGSLSVAG
jgi:GGDEF domain-containing protein